MAPSSDATGKFLHLYMMCKAGRPCKKITGALICSVCPDIGEQLAFPLVLNRNIQSALDSSKCNLNKNLIKWGPPLSLSQRPPISFSILPVSRNRKRRTPESHSPSRSEGNITWGISWSDLKMAVASDSITGWASFLCMGMKSFIWGHSAFRVYIISGSCLVSNDN